MAFLKAQLDLGGDQLGIFLPVVLDVLPDMPNHYFIAAEVQEAVATRHGIVMPQETISTLLKRATGERILLRDVGRYQINPGKIFKRPHVSEGKTLAVRSQDLLAAALFEHLTKRGITQSDKRQALELLVGFIDQQQVSVLLGVPSETDSADLSRSELAAVAEFLQNVVAPDPALKSALDDILQGLVLYRAAFLPDLAEVSRKFDNLTVAFDTVLVRRALGYEGTAPRSMIRETLDLLAASSVRCVVFEQTVQEIYRILRMYQEKLATSEGRSSLRPGAMARHFLTQRYSPSDVQEMSALLRDEIRKAGFTIDQTPARIARYTSGEAKLAARLADPITRDVTEPRVQHDVDCIAGVLSIRAGRRSNGVETARAVFATVSPLVIQNVRLWWVGDEDEVGIPPIVHLSALANLAWLKRPSAGQGMQMADLLTLCSSAMRPSARIWKRFMTHLDGLNKSNRLSNDQVSMIISSALSDQLLHEAELDEDDSHDVDAGTLDEVVTRVISQYSADADARILQAEAEYDERMKAVVSDADARITAFESDARNAAERLRRTELTIDSRARGWARRTSNGVYWIIVGLVLIASTLLAVKSLFDSGWVGLVVSLAILLMTALEIVGVLSQLAEARTRLEINLTRRFRNLLGADDPERT